VGKNRNPNPGIDLELRDVPHISGLTPQLRLDRSNAIEEMMELHHRQKAADVRRMAEQLYFTLEIAFWFHASVEAGGTISDQTQLAVNSAVAEEPAFQHLQRVLNHLAARPIVVGECPRNAVVRPRTEPFPRREFIDIVNGLYLRVERYKVQLVNVLDNMDPYPALEREIGCEFHLVDSRQSMAMLFGADDGAAIRFGPFPTDLYNELERDLTNLLDRLRTAPSQAVPPPAYSSEKPPIAVEGLVFARRPANSDIDSRETATKKGRLWVDETKQLVWVDDKPFSCEANQAEFVALLLASTGHVSFNEAKSKIPSLKEEDRSDRFVNRIRKEIRDCIDRGSTRGYRILDEMR
jgi:hypothetical protein